MKCNNKCKGNKILCQYCQENYFVSNCFYKAHRANCEGVVVGYLVRNKKTGKIEGILNEANDFNELAFIKPESICALSKGGK